MHFNNASRPRNSVLDSFRGIAAFTVMFFHLFGAATNFEDYGFTPVIGKVFSGSVFAFYIISGFSILLSMTRQPSAPVFLFKRLLRLFPSYWFCLTVTTLFCIYIGNQHIDLVRYIANMTMLNELIGYQNIDVPYWTLKGELFFYFMMTGVLMFRLQKFILKFCYIWLFFSVLALFKASVFDIIFNLRFGVFFIAGMMFSEILYKKASIWVHFLIILCVITSWFIYKDLSITVPFAVMCIICYLFVYGKLNFLQSRFLSFLGFISYPLYLLHYAIGLIIINYVKSIGIGSLEATLLAAALSLFLATMVHYGFERPMFIFVSRRFNNYLKNLRS